MKCMIEQQYNEIREWQNKTFPQATPLSCANHLAEEVAELQKELENGNVDRDEIADCFLLLIGVCNKGGLEYSDIVGAIDSKMAENLKRKWGSVNEQGYVKHVDE